MIKVESITKEPTIKVGIILPEDRLNKVDLSIPQIKDKTSNKVFGDISASIFEDKIRINDKLYEEVTLNPEDQNDYLIIIDVPAGRGFHWQKKINVKVPGIINLKNIDGYIVLINQLPLEQYIKYVATSEMSSKCPSALLEAQTIAARSWLLSNRGANHNSSLIDVCNDDCCQRYQGITELSDGVEAAIQITCGNVLAYKGEVCDARYSKCCGGITESYENVWDGEQIPYLTSIFDQNNIENSIDDFDECIALHPKAFCSEYFIKASDITKYLGKVDTIDNYFRWQIEYSAEQLIDIINTKRNLDIHSLIDLIPLNRGNSGRITKLQIKFINTNNDIRSVVVRSEYAIRDVLHEKFLYSSAFLIDKSFNEEQIIDSIKLVGTGWGHGVGMCQFGALGMALNGYDSDEILKHYFKGSDIVKLY